MDSTRIPIANSVGIPGLDNLIRFLTRLKNHRSQSANADEVWDDVACEPMSIHGSPKSKAEVCGLRQALDDAKICMAALNHVQGQLRRRIKSLQKACLPMTLDEGMKSLPGEVLAQIFESGHYMTDNRMFGKRVSHVCQYFRQVSLRTPLLWSRISDFYSEDQFDAFLSRSGHADLDVSIACADQELRSAFGFIQRLRPHSDRWTQLRIAYKHLASEEALIPTNAPPSLQLPRLQHIYNDYYIDLSSWDLPSLSHIHGYDFALLPKHKFMSQVTFFEWYTDEIEPLCELLESIYSMTNLQFLSLTFVGSLRGVPCGSYPAKPNRHSVPIDTLQITFKYITYEWVIEPLYVNLSYLSPSTINLSLENVLGRSNDYPSYLFDRGDLFPYGSIINVRILGVYRPPYYTYKPFPFLTGLVRGCEIAHTIHIEADDTAFISLRDTPDQWTYFTNLRHLRFTRCDRLAEWEIRALVENLMINAAPGMGLQSLEVIKCPGISEDVLLELKDKVGSKLRWELESDDRVSPC
ncbi:hypothetical protein BD410DRAFT_902939 [Rickenella mellea]|uniref:Uncharacterized protein n=1 Tax=Rickenella mellea TaxID=50990 RepID=A0A4Y7PJH0_9AGAM|nr:hypothetical protein BD410DRAFT_902939 [Rickenella mellea]